MHTARRQFLVLLALTLAATSFPAVAQVVTATVPAAIEPLAEAVNPATNTTYVVNYCGDDPSCQSNGTVTVVNGATLSTQEVAVGYLPYSVAVNSVTNKIYVANLCGSDPTCQSNGTVTVIDGATNQITTVPTGSDEKGDLLIHCLDVEQPWRRSSPRRKRCSPGSSERRAAMADFLLAAAGFVLVTVALGLVRILRGPGDADRIMAAQLLGTGGIAALLLLAAAMSVRAAVDVALILALLAAFVTVAFVKGFVRSQADGA